MRISFIITSLLLLAGLFSYASDIKEEKKVLAHLAFENMGTNTDLALNYARKLEKLAEQDNDTVYLSYALKTQASIYNRHLNYTAALRVLERIQAFPNEKLYALINLANTYRLTDKEEDALYLYQKALEKDNSKSRSIFNGLGLLHLSKNHPQKAKEYFDKEL